MGGEVNSATLPKRQLTNLALCLAIVPLLGWWVTGLFDVDEGFYAAVVWEMNQRGEWITPYYNGSPWFEKPILAYWLAKPALMLFGDAIGPRLPSVLCAFGTCLLVAWYMRRRVSDDAATWSVLALSTSLLFVGVGRQMMTDMPLVLAFTAAMLTFWESLVGDKRWRILTAGLLGVAALAKGPVALILFVIIAGWTFFRQKDLRPAFRGYWLAGIGVLAAVLATWYVPVYLANGDLFVQEFLVEQNLKRFQGGDVAHTLRNPLAYLGYIPVVFAGMLPWSAWFWKSWPRKADEPDMAFRRYLFSWAFAIFLFFTASGAKLPHYVLPVTPPLAILVGMYLAQRKPLEDVRPVRWSIAWCVFVAILANAAFVIWYQRSGQEEAHAFARYIRANSRDGVPRTVAMFRITKPKGADKGTGTLKLRETSLPSFLLYLQATTVQTDLVQEVVDRKVHWLFTRKGRITSEVLSQFLAHGCQLNPVGPQEENFQLFEVVPLTRSSQPKLGFGPLPVGS